MRFNTVVKYSRRLLKKRNRIHKITLYSYIL